MYSIDGSDDLVASVASAVGRLVEAVADGRVRELSHGELSELVVEVRREQARLESVLLTAVGEVDARGSHVHEGALTTSAWLRMHARATPAEATATVRTGRALRSGVLPGTAMALARGDIHPRHAQVIAAGVVDAPDLAVSLIEPEAVEAARVADVRAVASVMRRFQHALDPDAADEAAVRRYERRGFSWAATLDGSMAFTGLADEVNGSLIATAVDAASPVVSGDPRTAAQRRLDGLAEIAKRFLETADAPRSGGGGHPHVIVTVDSHTLAGTVSAEPDPPSPAVPGAAGLAVPGSPGATLSWVGPIGGATARRVACDAVVTSVRLGPDGEVVETSTDRRYFTPAQRRAMIARDGDRCCVPYCDRPVSWADGHHLVAYEDGGPTTVGNGALPCAGHHQMVHEGHWRLVRHRDGRYSLHHRDGRVIGPEPHPPGHNRPPPHRRE